jgi:transposase InsO family protein
VRYRGHALQYRDGIFGDQFRRRVHGLGIEGILTAPRSPWQNPLAERLVGSVQRECLDHIIVLGASPIWAACTTSTCERPRDSPRMGFW